MHTTEEDKQCKMCSTHGTVQWRCSYKRRNAGPSNYGARHDRLPSVVRVVVTDSSTCVECSGGYCRLISDSASVVRKTCFRQSVGVIYIQTHMTSCGVLPAGGSEDMPVTILLSHCFLDCSCGGLRYDLEAVPMKRVYISARNLV